MSVKKHTTGGCMMVVLSNINSSLPSWTIARFLGGMACAGTLAGAAWWLRPRLIGRAPSGTANFNTDHFDEGRLGGVGTVCTDGGWGETGQVAVVVCGTGKWA